MPTHFFPLTILTQHFEDETFLSEAINFYEISRFATNEETAIFNTRLNAEQILKDIYANFLHTRIASENLEIKEIFVDVEPPKRSEAWREKISLKFHAVCCEREDGYWQAFIPTLTLVVLTKKASEFETKIKKEILSALKRGNWTKSLQYLRWLEKVEKVTLQKEELAITLPTAKQRAIAEENDTEEEKSVLEEVGTNLFESVLHKAYEVEKQTEVLVEILKANPKTSVLLIGSSGVGKTALFHELVRQREKFDFKDNEFWATSGSRLIAGQSGFGMWQERCQKLINEAKKRNAIIHLGNLIELLEVGKSESSTQGIASFLRPKIARGEIIVVCEATPEQLPILERRDPNLLSAFQQIHVEEPDKKTGLRILESVAKEYSQLVDKQARKTETEAIKTIDAVHRRFSTYSVFPGKPVRFLRNLFQTAKQDEAVSAKTVYQAFSNETGLPEMLLNDEINFDLAETEKFFAKRVIGQEEAVNLVTKMIATVKAKLTRPRKPIASLLFIGPTGVGKTELTKALAEFFFSDSERLIRFDMSEFSNPLSVQRLIGGTGEKEGQLTAKVREQPFSVVLLDEFEKAHHSFFDLLLQMLGEGRLTDSVGRVADFTNSIIVMTSNLGASEFQRGKSGFTRNQRERKIAVKHFDSAVKSFLRPEIYNRIDRIVPFAPLDEQTVLQIAKLEIEKIKRRDGLRFRPIQLKLKDDVLNYLAETGYDIRYGARPLKRTVERELLAPLSTELNLRSIDEKLTIDSSLKDGKILLEFISENEPKKRNLLNNVLASQAERIGTLRRKMQKFSTSYKLTELRDEIYQVVRLESLELRGKWVSEEDRERIKRKPKIQNFLDRVAEFAEKVNKSEDEILLEIYGKSLADNQKFAKEIKENEERFNEYLFELLSLQYAQPNEIQLTFFSENTNVMFHLVRNYLRHLQNLEGKVNSVLYFTSEKQKDQISETKNLFDREIWRQEAKNPESILENSPKNVFGILMKIEGKLALPRFGAESGVHRFISGTKSDRVLVGSTDARFEKFEISDDLTKRDSLKFLNERRIYDLSKEEIKDLHLEKTFPLINTSVEAVLPLLIERNLQQTTENLIG